MSVRDVADQQILLVTRSASGDYFCMEDVAGVTGQGSTDAANVAACTGGF